MATTEVKPAEVKKLAPARLAMSPVPAAATIEDGATTAQASTEKTMDQATKAAEGLFKAAEEAAEFSRGNVEAVAKAAQLYMTGMQDIGRQAFALMQGLTDQALEGAKAFSGVKSLKEAAELQASFSRTAFERSMSESAKLHEAALKLAEQSFAPLSARVTLAVEKMGRPLAA